VIAGGGYIAVEFAGIFNGLGVETTLVYRRGMILRGFDDDLRAALTAEMTKEGNPDHHRHGVRPHRQDFRTALR
jgi:glutathione reductase (NADPH)